MGRIIEKLKNSFVRGGLTCGPYQIQLHLTDSCNLQCIFCPTKTLLQKGNIDVQKELTTPQWITLIEQAVKLGVEEFHICGGGEPFFFREKALAVMRRIKELGASGEVITNGTMFTSGPIGAIVGMGWDKITFSIDGPTADIHDAIRGRPSFGRIMGAMQEFTRLKKEFNAEKPQLCVHFVVCSLNYKSIPQMIPLCIEAGADTFLIQALNVWSDDILRYKLSEEQEEELQGILKEALAGAKRAGIATNIQDFLRHDLFSKANAMDKAMISHKRGESFLDVPCYMPWYNLSVFADGRCLPCFILRDKGVSFNEHSLAEAWNSNYFKALRGQMLANKLGKDCAKCNPWSLTKTEEIRAALRKGES